MSTTTTDKRIIIHGAPFGYMHLITPGAKAVEGGASTVLGSIAEKFIFDNLGSIDIKLLKPGGSTAGSTEYNDIKRADGALIRSKKYNLSLDLADEHDITDVTAASDATSLGSATMVVNEAPLPTSINSWTAFISLLREYHGAYWLLSIPTGFTFTSRVDSKVDGWSYMVCKIASDFNWTQAETPSSISIELISYKCPDIIGAADVVVTDTILQAIDYTSVNWKGCNKTFVPDATGTTTNHFAADDLVDIKAGKVSLVDAITYSYT